MSAVKRGLGRGLSDLGVSELLSEIQTPSHKSQLRKLPIDVIEPGKYQPRKDMDYEALEDLANSIRAQGIIQPILVRPISGNRYEIIAGERRWRASQMAQLHEIPAVIRDIPDEAAVAMSLIENIQREDLNSIEEAVAFKRLIDEFDMTHQEVGEAVGRSRTTVTNLLRLLNLPLEVKTMVEHGDLEMGHARALLPLELQLQIHTANSVIAKELSVRETEKLIKRLQNPKATKKTATLDPNVSKLQQDLSDLFGAQVAVLSNNSGKGKLTINFNSLSELQGILNKMGYKPLG